MEKTVSREEFAQCFPFWNRIENPEWKTCVYEIWKEFFQMSEWEHLRDARFMPLTPEVSLVEHVENVTEGSVALAEVSVKNYQTPVDFDVLIVSALLHDVSKLIEMAPGKEGIEKTKIGKTFQHGYYGAYAAQSRGLPDCIVTNILTHTGFSKTPPSTIEGIFLFYADMADSDTHRFRDGITLNIMHHK